MWNLPYSILSAFSSPCISPILEVSKKKFGSGRNKYLGGFSAAKGLIYQTENQNGDFTIFFV
jgi:hypothetical protein